MRRKEERIVKSEPINIKSGDIILASYGKFDGTTGSGIFLVLYCESSDRRYASNIRDNVICAKITTNNLLGDSYVVRLRQGEANIKEESLVNISKLHVLANNQVIRVIGTLNQGKMTMIYKEYHNFNSEIERQLLERL